MIPDGAREALIHGLKRIELRPVNLQGRGRVISADHMADALLTALSAAGYVVTKANPTLADLAEEQGVTGNADVASLAMADELTEEDNDAFLAAVQSCRSDETWTEYSIQRTDGTAWDERLTRYEVTAIDQATGLRAVQREVSAGPWVPVSREEPEAAAKCRKCSGPLSKCLECGNPAQCGELVCVACTPDVADQVSGWVSGEEQP